jgi:hypothetical protein
MIDARPHLILGEDLIEFVQSRQKAKPKSAPDQFRCFTCQTLTSPLDRIVFYTSLTPSRGQLEAICEVCGGACFKFAGEKRLASLSQILEIVRNNARQA